MTVPSNTGPEALITPEGLALAVAGTRRRGARLRAGLGAAAALSAVGGALGVAALAWGVRALPDLLARLAALDGNTTPFNTTPFQVPPLPGWALPSLAFLVVIGVALQVWAIMLARAVITAVQGAALHPGPQSAAALSRRARTVRPWITLGQLWPVVSAALSMLLTLGSELLASSFGASQGTDLGPLEAVLAALGAAVSSLPTIIINWLILRAIRRLLDGVVTRTQGQPVATRPLARPVDTWLLFTLVLLVLGTLGTLLGALTFLFFPTLLSAVTQDTTTGMERATLQLMRGAFTLGAVAMLVGALTYAALATLIAWSRGFALNVTTVLDATLPDAPQAAPTPDPWAGEVIRAPDRDPR